MDALDLLEAWTLVNTTNVSPWLTTASVLAEHCLRLPELQGASQVTLDFTYFRPRMTLKNFEVTQALCADQKTLEDWTPEKLRGILNSHAIPEKLWTVYINRSLKKELPFSKMGLASAFCQMFNSNYASMPAILIMGLTRSILKEYGHDVMFTLTCKGNSAIHDSSHRIFVEGAKVITHPFFLPKSNKKADYQDQLILSFGGPSKINIRSYSEPFKIQNEIPKWLGAMHSGFDFESGFEDLLEGYLISSRGSWCPDGLEGGHFNYFTRPLERLILNETARNRLPVNLAQDFPLLEKTLKKITKALWKKLSYDFYVGPCPDLSKAHKDLLTQKLKSLDIGDVSQYWGYTSKVKESVTYLIQYIFLDVMLTPFESWQKKRAHYLRLAQNMHPSYPI
jgi:hypothetical protein